MADERLGAGQEARVLGVKVVGLLKDGQVVAVVADLGRHVASSRGRGAVEVVRGDTRASPGWDWSALAERMHVLVIKTKQEVILVFSIVSKKVEQVVCAES